MPLDKTRHPYPAPHGEKDLERLFPLQEFGYTNMPRAPYHLLPSLPAVHCKHSSYMYYISRVYYQLLLS